MAQQSGLLRMIQNGSLLVAPALDQQRRLAPPLVLTRANDERACLGLAFHPGYSTLKYDHGDGISITGSWRGWPANLVAGRSFQGEMEISYRQRNLESFALS